MVQAKDADHSNYGPFYSTHNSNKRCLFLAAGNSGLVHFRHASFFFVSAKRLETGHKSQ